MLRILLPHPILQPFVKAYWFLDLTKGSGVPLSMSPAPEHCLYFYPRSQPQVFDFDGKPMRVFDNVLMGQAVTGGTKLLVPDRYCMFKILFQPSGLFRLFKTPMMLFANTYEESMAVLGSPIKQLREQIGNASDFEEMVHFSNRFLLQQLSKSPVKTQPIDAVLYLPHLHRFDLSHLSASACLSPRQFERKFLERVGVSPKIYQRLIRFNQVMNLKHNYPHKKWMDITYECGYFDPNHLLRDFRQFTGVVPTGFDFENAVIY